VPGTLNAWFSSAMRTQSASAAAEVVASSARAEVVAASGPVGVPSVEPPPPQAASIATIAHAA
jgi:hypothetical protein